MIRKNSQIYICAMGDSGAKHYLAVGATKLQKEDLKSFYTDAPTARILQALDGMRPAVLAWVEFERMERNRFAVNTQYFTKNGEQECEPVMMGGRDMRIGELADIQVDEIWREYV